MPNTEQPNFDEEFDAAVAEWRDKHRLREDDAVMLLVELFRIHQQHWDELRRREIPSFEQFRADTPSWRRRRGHFDNLRPVDVLRKLPRRTLQHRSRTAAFFAALASLLAGYLIGDVAVKLTMPFSPIAFPPTELPESPILSGSWQCRHCLSGFCSSTERKLATRLMG